MALIPQMYHVICVSMLALAVDRNTADLNIKDLFRNGHEHQDENPEY
jgi:hypothetical protein